jgi:hypothetical protein
MPACIVCTPERITIGLFGQWPLRLAGMRRRKKQA